MALYSGLVASRRAVRPLVPLLRTCTTMAARSLEGVGISTEKEVPYVVGHDKKNQLFHIKLKGEDGKISDEKAILEYQWVRQGVADLYHTEVPPSFRGKGIAKVLAKAAFDYVVENDSKMRLSCTYLQKYIKDNPLPEYTSREEPLQ